MSNRIISIANFNAYCGRYSRKANLRTPESKVGWYIEDNLLEKIPILALRNRNIDDRNSSPLMWRRNRNLFQAINLTLETLKAWQAFRPEKSQKIIKDLKNDLPQIIISFQNSFFHYRIKNIWDITKLDQDNYNHVLKIMSKIVGNLSSYKTDLFPMLGSKIMHFLFPEIFPVWDTAWIKNVCLNNEAKNLQEWLPKEINIDLRKYNKAATEYSSYLALMLSDLDQVGKREYKKVEKAFIDYSSIPQEAIFWHFYDISTIVFEFCLLGKHVR